MVSVYLFVGMCWIVLAVILVIMLTKLQCPDCSSYMELRTNKYGDFYACTDFPICKGKMSSREVYRQEQIMLAKQKAQTIPDNIKKCPECDSVMMLRHRKDTKETFYGCSKYPKCCGTLPDYDGKRIADAAHAIAQMRKQNV